MKPEDLKVVDAIDYASGTADVQTAGVDMANAEFVIAIVKLATIATGAVTSTKWQQSSDNGSSDGWSDLVGSSISIADGDDNEVVARMLVKPEKRYVRLYVDKDATNAVALSATYVVGGCRTAPGFVSSSDVTCDVMVSPAEGTA